MCILSRLRKKCLGAESSHLQTHGLPGRVPQLERKLSLVSLCPRGAPDLPTATGTGLLSKLSVLVHACFRTFVVCRKMPLVLQPCAHGLRVPGGVPAPNPTGTRTSASLPTGPGAAQSEELTCFSAYSRLFVWRVTHS